MTITTNESWLFEIKAVRAIKVRKYGEPYSAIAHLTIVDGVLHVEGLLSQQATVGKKDLKEIECYIKSLGFNEYVYSRYKNGERATVKKVIKWQ